VKFQSKRYIYYGLKDRLLIVTESSSVFYLGGSFCSAIDGSFSG